MDTESLRVRVLDASKNGPEAVVALVGTLLSELAVQVEMVSARVANLEGENATLRTENAALRARLETNSRNSGKPPSSDGPGLKPHPQSQRVSSGRKPGGQPGHEGHSVRLRDAPDAVQVHTPSCCRACRQRLDDVPVLRQERRQVIDIPPLKVWVMEHQAVTKCCPACGTQTSGTFPPDVAAPVQYGPGVATLAVYLTQEQLLPLARTSAVLAEVFGCPVAEGTLERAIAACHEQLAAPEAAIKHGVTAAAVAHFDETGVNLNGTTAWLHVASTPRLTFYAVHQKRGKEALEAIGVVPQFRGRAVHDGLTSYGQYEQCAHALCHAHHLRELTFVEEQLGQGWARNLKEVLLEIKQTVDDARAQGLAGLTIAAKREFERRYDAALADGMEANPPPPPTGKRGRPKRRVTIVETVFGWKVLVLIDVQTRLPLAMTVGQIQEYEGRFLLPLVRQAQQNLGTAARITTVVIDRGYLDGEDLWALDQAGLTFVIVAKDNMAVAEDARSLAVSGAGHVRERVEIIRHGHGHGHGRSARTERRRTRLVGVVGLTSYDAYGDVVHAQQCHRKDFDGHPLNAVVVLQWGTHASPKGGTVFLTNGAVQDPFVAFDLYDWRSVIENGIFKEGKHPWHLQHFPQRTEAAVLVQCYFTLTVMALCTAFRLCQEAADATPATGRADTDFTPTSALLGGEGTQRWRHRLKEENRDHVIVFIGPRYGIFHVAELAVLAVLRLKTLPPTVGTPQDILTRFGLGP